MSDSVVDRSVLLVELGEFGIVARGALWFATPSKTVTLSTYFGLVGSPVWCLRPTVNNQTGSVFYWWSREVTLGSKNSSVRSSWCQ